MPTPKISKYGPMLLTTPNRVGVASSMENYIVLSGVSLNTEQNTTPIVQFTTPKLCCVFKTQF